MSLTFLLREGLPKLQQEEREKGTTKSLFFLLALLNECGQRAGLGRRERFGRPEGRQKEEH
jgi:hypothetical protein